METLGYETRVYASGLSDKYPITTHAIVGGSVQNLSEIIDKVLEDPYEYLPKRIEYEFRLASTTLFSIDRSMKLFISSIQTLLDTIYKFESYGMTEELQFMQEFKRLIYIDNSDTLFVLDPEYIYNERQSGKTIDDIYHRSDDIPKIQLGSFYFNHNMSIVIYEIMVRKGYKTLLTTELENMKRIYEKMKTFMRTFIVMKKKGL